MCGFCSLRRKGSYDANGNALTRQGSTIGWTSYNYPTVVSAGVGSTAEVVSFLYGPARQRWQQAYSGNGINETTNYIGGLLEQVVSGGVTNYRHYIYAGSEPVAVYSRTSAGTNTFSYMLSDHQGSVSDLTSSTGTSTVNESLTPFGIRRNPTTWSGAASNLDLTTAAGITRQGYTFQTQLGLWMGLNHMNGRVQDAITGRFLSADPTIPDPTNTQSYNRYSYVNNNPLSLVDPTGFDPKPCGTDGCPGGQWNWSCYGDCGTSFFNSYGTVTVPGTNIQIPWVGDPSMAVDQAYSLESSAAAFAAPANPFSQFQPSANSFWGGGASGSAALGSQLPADLEFNAPPIPIGFGIGTYGPVGVTGNFACGTFQCSYQIGPLSNGDLSGAWIRGQSLGRFWRWALGAIMEHQYQSIRHGYTRDLPLLPILCQWRAVFRGPASAFL